MKHLKSFNEAKKNWTIQDIFDRIKEIEDAKFVKIKGKDDEIPLTDEMKRKYISALEDIIEDSFNKTGIRYERKYKTLKERKYVTKYRNFKPFYFEVENGTLVQVSVTGGVKTNSDPLDTSVIWFKEADKKEMIFLTRNNYEAWKRKVFQVKTLK